MTPSEVELAAELRGYVERLAGDIGERNLGMSWQLAEANDFLATTLEGFGYEVRRLGYAVGEHTVQNLEVELPGGSRGKEVLVVGAHYDTHRGTPGADDNASGVAAVLALARRMSDAQPGRSVRFVLFTNEEEPYFGTEHMGSLHYAKQAAAAKDHIVLMMSLESIGYFSDEPGSQRYPEALEGRYPTTGDFIAVVSNEESAKLLKRVLALMERHASLPVLGAALPEETPGVAASDQWAFWEIDVPAVMITDTAPFRNPHYHRPSDLPRTLDYGRFARVVAALEPVIMTLAGQ